MNHKSFPLLWILHTTCILSLLLAISFTITSINTPLWLTLLLFFPISISYVTNRYIHHTFFYVLITLCTGLLVFLLPFTMIEKISFFLFICYIFLYRFYCKATKKESWMEFPNPYLFLFFVISYIAAIITKTTNLQTFIHLLTFFYLLLYVLHTNWKNLDYFLSVYEQKAGFSKKHLKKQNRKVFASFLAIMLLCMVCLPALGIDTLISSFLSSALTPDFSKPYVEDNQPTFEYISPEFVDEQLSESITETTNTFSWLTVILDTIIIIIAIFIGITILVIIVKTILHILTKTYSSSDKKREVSSDEVEFTFSFQKRKKVSLWNDFSPNGMIRKRYVKIVKKQAKQTHTTIQPSWSPTEIEQHCHLDEATTSMIHPLYVKARYSKDGCTKYDVKELKSSLK